VPLPPTGTRCAAKWHFPLMVDTGLAGLKLDSAISVVVARELLSYESVLVGAGAVGVEIEVSPLELVCATNALVENIAKQDA
jgi:prolyl-tRNA editing enzyme YbaK/EbsC (Cys-tRNA(Pro) deacylase)